MFSLTWLYAFLFEEHLKCLVLSLPPVLDAIFLLPMSSSLWFFSGWQGNCFVGTEIEDSANSKCHYCQFQFYFHNIPWEKYLIHVNKRILQQRIQTFINVFIVDCKQVFALLYCFIDRRLFFLITIIITFSSSCYVD